MITLSDQARSRLYFHSPLGFMRECVDAVASKQLASLEEGEVECRGDATRLWVRHLGWDSRFFGCDVFRIDFADWPVASREPSVELAAQIRRLSQELLARGRRIYLFCEVPSEDIVLMQALGLAGMRLIETRLTYVHDAPGAARRDSLTRVRAAGPEDIVAVRKAAAEARNEFDRYHADPFFGTEVADAYLAEYAEQCIRGFSDVVLVPADREPASAFVCAKADIEAPGVRTGRLQLAGVAASRRGWYRTLGEALLVWMHEQGVARVVNTTQATNRAVIHVSSQLGYRYGRAAHVFALAGNPSEMQHE